MRGDLSVLHGAMNRGSEQRVANILECVYVEHGLPSENRRRTKTRAASCKVCRGEMSLSLDWNAAEDVEPHPRLPVLSVLDETERSSVLEHSLVRHGWEVVRAGPPSRRRPIALVWGNQLGIRDGITASGFDLHLVSLRSQRQDCSTGRTEGGSATVVACVLSLATLRSLR